MIWRVSGALTVEGDLGGWSPNVGIPEGSQKVTVSSRENDAVSITRWHNSSHYPIRHGMPPSGMRPVGGKASWRQGVHPSPVGGAALRRRCWPLGPALWRRWAVQGTYRARCRAGDVLLQYTNRGRGGAGARVLISD